MPSTPVSVAVVQLNSQDHVEHNLHRCEQLVGRAARAGAKILLLPENFALFGTSKQRRAHAEPLGTEADGDCHSMPIQDALARWAKHFDVSIIGGGMPISSGDPSRPFNTSRVVARCGDAGIHYHKIHLFDVDLPDGSSLRESDSTSAGSEVKTCQLEGLTVGLSICYDLRFPELFRQLVDRGADVLTVPAAFTLQTGKDHWEVLLRARAIESQCWVIAAGQTGTHPQGRVCFGNSMIIDPWGTVVSRCSEGEGLALATIDTPSIDRVRAQVPSLRHRRLLPD